MHYIDSGSRDAGQALGSWLRAVLSENIAEIRWQSGFFGQEPLALFADTLNHLASTNGRVHVLIGSNAPGTQRDDVLRLVQLIGLPRPNASLGVVQYGNAFFHPKTYHFKRADGSQCAYVGSANLTEHGVSLHVEAGVVLDMQEGDPATILMDVAAAVDSWFLERRAGLHIISDADGVRRLVADGVLVVAPPPAPPSPPATRGGIVRENAAASPRLTGLVRLPPLPPLPGGPEPPPAAEPVPLPASGPVEVETRAGFPPNVLFAPGLTTPTAGIEALSDRPLAHGIAGVVIRLSGDTIRVFTGQVGTANLSLPAGTIETLRFGRLGRGRWNERPRAEYDLMVRYIGTGTASALPEPAETNVMLYGYLPGETGHRDIRMLIPADVRELIPQIQGSGRSLPEIGDYALLEWPTMADPAFRLTFIEPTHVLAAQARDLFDAAAAGHHLLGDNGCALPDGVSPTW